MNNLIRQLRAELGWSQAHLAELLNVSRQTVNAIETGRYDPSLPLAFRVARLFDQPIEAIFEPEPDPATRPRATTGADRGPVRTGETDSVRPRA